MLSTIQKWIEIKEQYSLQDVQENVKYNTRTFCSNLRLEKLDQWKIWIKSIRKLERNQIQQTQKRMRSWNQPTRGCIQRVNIKAYAMRVKKEEALNQWLDKQLKAELIVKSSLRYVVLFFYIPKNKSLWLV